MYAPNLENQFRVVSGSAASATQSSSGVSYSPFVDPLTGQSLLGDSATLGAMGITDPRLIQIVMDWVTSTQSELSAEQAAAVTRFATGMAISSADKSVVQDALKGMVTATNIERLGLTPEQVAQLNTEIRGMDTATDGIAKISSEFRNESMAANGYTEAEVTFRDRMGLIAPKDPCIQLIIDELTAQGKIKPGMSDTVIARNVTAYVQENFTYISDGVSVEGKSRDQWNSISETMAAKGGDCEDLSIVTASLMMAALSKAGYSDAEVHKKVTLAAGYLVDPSGAFKGHSTVKLVADNGDTLSLDATSKNPPTSFESIGMDMVFEGNDQTFIQYQKIDQFFQTAMDITSGAQGSIVAMVEKKLTALKSKVGNPLTVPIPSADGKSFTYYNQKTKSMQDITRHPDWKNNKIDMEFFTIKKHEIKDFGGTWSSHMYTVTFNPDAFYKYMTSTRELINSAVMLFNIANGVTEFERNQAMEIFGSGYEDYEKAELFEIMDSATKYKNRFVNSMNGSLTKIGGSIDTVVNQMFTFVNGTNNAQKARIEAEIAQYGRENIATGVFAGIADELSGAFTFVRSTATLEVAAVMSKVTLENARGFINYTTKFGEGIELLSGLTPAQKAKANNVNSFLYLGNNIESTLNTYKNNIKRALDRGLSHLTALEGNFGSYRSSDDAYRETLEVRETDSNATELKDSNIIGKAGDNSQYAEVGQNYLLRMQEYMVEYHNILRSVTLITNARNAKMKEAAEQIAALSGQQAGAKGTTASGNNSSAVSGALEIELQRQQAGLSQIGNATSTFVDTANSFVNARYGYARWFKSLSEKANLISAIAIQATATAAAPPIAVAAGAAYGAIPQLIIPPVVITDVLGAVLVQQYVGDYLTGAVPDLATAALNLITAGLYYNFERNMLKERNTNLMVQEGSIYGTDYNLGEYNTTSYLAKQNKGPANPYSDSTATYYTNKMESLLYDSRLTASGYDPRVQNSRQYVTGSINNGGGSYSLKDGPAGRMETNQFMTNRGDGRIVYRGAAMATHQQTIAMNGVKISMYLSILKAYQDALEQAAANMFGKSKSGQVSTFDTQINAIVNKELNIANVFRSETQSRIATINSQFEKEKKIYESTKSFARAGIKAGMQTIRAGTEAFLMVPFIPFAWLGTPYYFSFVAIETAFKVADNLEEAAALTLESLGPYGFENIKYNANSPNQFPGDITDQGFLNRLKDPNPNAYDTKVTSTNEVFRKLGLDKSPQFANAKQGTIDELAKQYGTYARLDELEYIQLNRIKNPDDILTNSNGVSGFAGDFQQLDYEVLLDAYSKITKINQIRTFMTMIDQALYQAKQNALRAMFGGNAGAGHGAITVMGAAIDRYITATLDNVFADFQAEASERMNAINDRTQEQLAVVLKASAIAAAALASGIPGLGAADEAVEQALTLGMGKDNWIKKSQKFINSSMIVSAATGLAKVALGVTMMETVKVNNPTITSELLNYKEEETESTSDDATNQQREEALDSKLLGKPSESSINFDANNPVNAGKFDGAGKNFDIGSGTSSQGGKMRVNMGGQAHAQAMVARRERQLTLLREISLALTDAKADMAEDMGGGPAAKAAYRQINSIMSQQSKLENKGVEMIFGALKAQAEAYNRGFDMLMEGVVDTSGRAVDLALKGANKVAGGLDAKAKGLRGGDAGKSTDMSKNKTGNKAASVDSSSLAKSSVARGMENVASMLRSLGTGKKYWLPLLNLAIVEAISSSKGNQDPSLLGGDDANFGLQASDMFGDTPNLEQEGGADAVGGDGYQAPKGSIGFMATDQLETAILANSLIQSGYSWRAEQYADMGKVYSQAGSAIAGALKEDFKALMKAQINAQMKKNDEKALFDKANLSDEELDKEINQHLDKLEGRQSKGDRVINNAINKVLSSRKSEESIAELKKKEQGGTESERAKAIQDVRAKTVREVRDKIRAQAAEAAVGKKDSRAARTEGEQALDRVGMDDILILRNAVSELHDQELKAGGLNDRAKHDPAAAKLIKDQALEMEKLADLASGNQAAILRAAKRAGLSEDRIADVLAQSGVLGDKGFYEKKGLFGKSGRLNNLTRKLNPFSTGSFNALSLEERQAKLQGSLAGGATADESAFLGLLAEVSTLEGFNKKSQELRAKTRDRLTTVEEAIQDVTLVGGHRDMRIVDTDQIKSDTVALDNMGRQFNAQNAVLGQVISAANASGQVVSLQQDARGEVAASLLPGTARATSNMVVVDSPSGPIQVAAPVGTTPEQAATMLAKASGQVFQMLGVDAARRNLALQIVGDRPQLIPVAGLAAFDVTREIQPLTIGRGLTVQVARPVGSVLTPRQEAQVRSGVTARMKAVEQAPAVKIGAKDRDGQRSIGVTLAGELEAGPTEITLGDERIELRSNAPVRVGLVDPTDQLTADGKLRPDLAKSVMDAVRNYKPVASVAEDGSVTVTDRFPAGNPVENTKMMVSVASGGKALQVPAVVLNTSVSSDGTISDSVKETAGELAKKALSQRAAQLPPVSVASVGPDGKPTLKAMSGKENLKEYIGISMMRDGENRVVLVPRGQFIDLNSAEIQNQLKGGVDGDNFAMSRDAQAAMDTLKEINSVGKDGLARVSSQSIASAQVLTQVNGELGLRYRLAGEGYSDFKQQNIVVGGIRRTVLVPKNADPIDFASADVQRVLSQSIASAQVLTQVNGELGLRYRLAGEGDLDFTPQDIEVGGIRRTVLVPNADRIDFASLDVQQAVRVLGNARAQGDAVQLVDRRDAVKLQIDVASALKGTLGKLDIAQLNRDQQMLATRLQGATLDSIRLKNGQSLSTSEMEKVESLLEEEGLGYSKSALGWRNFRAKTGRRALNGAREDVTDDLRNRLLSVVTGTPEEKDEKIAKIIAAVDGSSTRELADRVVAATSRSQNKAASDTEYKRLVALAGDAAASRDMAALAASYEGIDATTQESKKANLKALSKKLIENSLERDDVDSVAARLFRADGAIIGERRDQMIAAEARGLNRRKGAVAFADLVDTALEESRFEKRGEQLAEVYGKAQAESNRLNQMLRSGKRRELPSMDPDAVSTRILAPFKWFFTNQAQMVEDEKGELQDVDDVAQERDVNLTLMVHAEAALRAEVAHLIHSGDDVRAGELLAGALRGGGQQGRDLLARVMQDFAIHDLANESETKAEKQTNLFAQSIDLMISRYGNNAQVMSGLGQAISKAVEKGDITTGRSAGMNLEQAGLATRMGRTVYDLLNAPFDGDRRGLTEQRVTEEITSTLPSNTRRKALGTRTEEARGFLTGKSLERVETNMANAVASRIGQIENLHKMVQHMARADTERMVRHLDAPGQGRLLASVASGSVKSTAFDTAQSQLDAIKANPDGFSETEKEAAIKNFALQTADLFGGLVAQDLVSGNAGNPALSSSGLGRRIVQDSIGQIDGIVKDTGAVRSLRLLLDHQYASAPGPQAEYLNRVLGAVLPHGDDLTLERRASVERIDAVGKRVNELAAGSIEAMAKAGTFDATLTATFMLGIGNRLEQITDGDLAVVRSGEFTALQTLTEAIKGTGGSVPDAYLPQTQSVRVAEILKMMSDAMELTMDNAYRLQAERRSEFQTLKDINQALATRQESAVDLLMQSKDKVAEVVKKSISEGNFESVAQTLGAIKGLSGENANQLIVDIARMLNKSEEKTRFLEYLEKSKIRAGEFSAEVSSVRKAQIEARAQFAKALSESAATETSPKVAQAIEAVADRETVLATLVADVPLLSKDSPVLRELLADPVASQQLALLVAQGIALNLNSAYKLLDKMQGAAGENGLSSFGKSLGKELVRINETKVETQRVEVKKVFEKIKEGENAKLNTAKENSLTQAIGTGYVAQVYARPIADLKGLDRGARGDATNRILTEGGPAAVDATRAMIFDMSSSDPNRAAALISDLHIINPQSANTLLSGLISKLPLADAGEIVSLSKTFAATRANLPGLAPGETQLLLDEADAFIKQGRNSASTDQSAVLTQAVLGADVSVHVASLAGQIETALGGVGLTDELNTVLTQLKLGDTSTVAVETLLIDGAAVDRDAMMELASQFEENFSVDHDSGRITLKSTPSDEQIGEMAATPGFGGLAREFFGQFNLLARFEAAAPAPGANPVVDDLRKTLNASMGTPKFLAEHIQAAGRSDISTLLGEKKVFSKLDGMLTTGSVSLSDRLAAATSLVAVGTQEQLESLGESLAKLAIEAQRPGVADGEKRMLGDLLKPGSDSAKAMEATLNREASMERQTVEENRAAGYAGEDRDAFWTETDRLVSAQPANQCKDAMRPMADRLRSMSPADQVAAMAIPEFKDRVMAEAPQLYVGFMLSPAGNGTDAQGQLNQLRSGDLAQFVTDGITPEKLKLLVVAEGAGLRPVQAAMDRAKVTGDDACLALSGQCMTLRQEIVAGLGTGTLSGVESMSTSLSGSLRGAGQLLSLRSAATQATLLGLASKIEKHEQKGTSYHSEVVQMMGTLAVDNPGLSKLAEEIQVKGGSEGEASALSQVIGEVKSQSLSNSGPIIESLSTALVNDVMDGVVGDDMQKPGLVATFDSLVDQMDQLADFV